MKILFGLGEAVILTLYKGFKVMTHTKTETQANRYFPIRSPAEIVAGHPIVGVV